ncbi:succinyl-coa:3-ketoacid-coenzyme a transferase-like protein [Trypanosoma grayi]|uniref:succinyl-coa:3-ketoacid-coenzyme a transferase-like protein n=1 Tax=Trypanosoma grayi TaxID=71804 RepID=UPI0004F428CC|nr:succinyl-coa:3-ketoacid-coenzyme a transferase-like protein [Trypanosoma grayi]KEG07043.1 succinyl-coa:3-ketoacid-coenzyme a transferase-like protein [Trypanosoma grayi]
MFRRSLSRIKAKVMPSVDALRDLGDGASIAVGGFGVCGMPTALLGRLNKDGRKSLHVISAATNGEDSVAMGRLLNDGQVDTLTTSHLGLNKLVCNLLNEGKLKLDLSPMGTLVERLRCGGAGIPAFYTTTGFGTGVSEGSIPATFSSDGSGRVTKVSEPRETREVHGRWCVLEHAIETDYAFIKAWKADTKGNLVFRGTTRNLNAVMATCARICIAEVEEIVEAGQLKPNEIHVPGIYVDRIVCPKNAEKHVIHNVNDGEEHVPVPLSEKQERIIQRAALELCDGMHVKLGIGLPSMVASFLPRNVKLITHSEAGMLWEDGSSKKHEWVDLDFTNDRAEAVVVSEPGASLFDSAVAFDMLRGGHLDATLLSAFEVSARGDIASWCAPGITPDALAGTTGIICSGGKIIALMEHVHSDGSPRIVEQCSMPVTGKGIVDTLITDLAVFAFVQKGGNAHQLSLKEVAEGVTIEELKAKTAADFLIPDDVKNMGQA